MSIPEKFYIRESSEQMKYLNYLFNFDELTPHPPVFIRLPLFLLRTAILFVVLAVSCVPVMTAPRKKNSEPESCRQK